MENGIMKTNFYSLLPLCCVLSLSCTSDTDKEDVTEGSIGTDGLNVLINTVEEDAGENCENGGILVSSGIDNNADGILGEDEILTEDYICNGVDQTANASNTLITDSEFIGMANEDCVGGYVVTNIGYDLDMNESLEGDEIETSFSTCNLAPFIDIESLTFVEDCSVDTMIPVSIMDSDGTVDNVEVTVLVSGSEITATYQDGMIVVPAGNHISGAKLTVSAVDNYGAETVQDMTLAFRGNDCIPTDTFHGVDYSTCIDIEVDSLAGDDRGGVTLTGQYAYYNGDDGLVRTDLNLENLTLLVSEDVDTLIGDPITGMLYSLWSSEIVETNLLTVGDQLEDNSDLTMWDQLAVIDENTLEVMSTVTLEQPMYVPDYNNRFDYDLGDGVETDVKAEDYIVGMRNGSLVIGVRLAGVSSGNYALKWFSIDPATGTTLNEASVNNLSADSTDDDLYSSLRWDEQEVDVQHYLLLERGSQLFMTYRDNNNEEMIELNTATLEYTVVSESFGLYSDMKNLAMDASGLYVYFHTEDGYSSYKEESMDKCMILFNENDGSELDLGLD